MVLTYSCPHFLFPHSLHKFKKRRHTVPREFYLRTLSNDHGHHFLHHLFGGFGHFDIRIVPWNRYEVGMVGIAHNGFHRIFILEFFVRFLFGRHVRTEQGDEAEDSEEEKSFHSIFSRAKRIHEESWENQSPNIENETRNKNYGADCLCTRHFRI